MVFPCDPSWQAVLVVVCCEPEADTPRLGSAAERSDRNPFLSSAGVQYRYRLGPAWTIVREDHHPLLEGKEPRRITTTIVWR